MFKNGNQNDAHQFIRLGSVWTNCWEPFQRAVGSAWQSYSRDKPRQEEGEKEARILAQ